MRIFINGDPLTAVTSGYPMRGLVKASIQNNQSNEFIISSRNKNSNDSISSFFSEVEQFSNVSFYIVEKNHKYYQIKALSGIKNYNNIHVKADLFISPGMPEYFGKNSKPLICIIADLSSIRYPQYSSLKWHGNRIFRNKLHWCVKNADYILTISEFTRKDLLDIYPGISNKISVLYNGIDPIWFEDNSYVPDKKIIPKDKYWIWWGYISNRKNLNNLIQAYKNLIKEIPNIPDLLIVGQTAPDQVKIDKYISEHLSDKVLRLPMLPLKDLKYLVKNSEGLVFPSLYEGFGLPIAESLSQGIPVLTSNISAMPEIAGKFGILCDPEDLESIKNGLQNLFCAEKGENSRVARKQWASLFSYENSAKKLSDIIEIIK